MPPRAPGREQRRGGGTTFRSAALFPKDEAAQLVPQVLDLLRALAARNRSASRTPLVRPPNRRVRNALNCRLSIRIIRRWRSPVHCERQALLATSSNRLQGEEAQVQSQCERALRQLTRPQPA